MPALRADAKRGDIDVTARAYAEAFLGETATPFGPVAGLGADALTVNPYMGADTLAPLLEVARPRGRGLFVLVRTSNPGAGDVEDLPTSPDGEPVWARVARMVDGLGDPAHPLGDVGAVVGATRAQTGSPSGDVGRSSTSPAPGLEVRTRTKLSLIHI